MYPVGSQLPTEHELCERFSVSRYTVREALRRLRDDNLVSSRPRAGTMVVPRVRVEFLRAGRHVDQRSAGLRERGAVSTIESTGMVTHRRRPRRAHRACRGRGVAGRAAASGRPTAPSSPTAATEYYINRAFAAVGRLLQRHTGPIFPLIEDLFGVSVVEVHQEIARRAGRPRSSPTASRSRAGSPARRGAPHLQDVGRRDRPGHHQHPPRVAVPPLDDACGGSRG